MMFAEYACVEPVELLRRVAADHGRQALEAVSGNYGGLLDGVDPADVARHVSNPARIDVDQYIAEAAARMAWRYAKAHVLLRNVAAILAAGPPAHPYTPDHNGECLICDEPADGHPDPADVGDI